MEFGTSQQTVPEIQSFEDRRKIRGVARECGPERRQFSDARVSQNFEALELAEAIDSYKVTHRRRFITFEELHEVISGLGYRKAKNNE